MHRLRLVSFRLIPSGLPWRRPRQSSAMRPAGALASALLVCALASSPSLPGPVASASAFVAITFASITFAPAAFAAAGDRAEDEDDDDMLPPDVATLVRTFGQHDDTAFLDTEPLLTHPLWLHADPGWRAALLRLPPDAQRLHGRAASAIAGDDLATAAAALDEAAGIVRRAGGDDDPALLVLWLLHASLDEKRGDRAAVLRRHRAARTLAERAFDDRSPWRAELLWREAAALLKSGDLAAARLAGEQAAAALSDRTVASDERVAALNNAAILRLAAGDAIGAQRGLEAALAALQASPTPTLVPGDGHWLRPRVLSNLGLARWYQGDGPAALQLYRQALAERAPWRSSEALSERAHLLLSQAAARELDAIATLERDGFPATDPLGPTALFERKGVLLDRQSRGMAALRQSLDTPPPRSGTLSGVLTRIFDPGGHAQRQTETLMAEAFRRADQDLLRRMQQAQGERVRLEQQRPVTDEEIAERRTAIARTDRELEQLEGELAQRPRAAQMREQVVRLMRDGAPPPTGDDADPRAAVAQAFAEHASRVQQERDALLTSVRAAIAPAAVLVELFVYRPLASKPAEAEPTPRYAAYVMRRDGPIHFVDLGEAASIDRLVTELRRTVSRPGEPAKAREAGRRLDERLLQPLRALWQGASEVLLAPEGQLNLVPFAALVDEDGRYLVERHVFNVLASGRDLIRHAAPAPAPRSPPLIIAAPTFGDPDAGATQQRALNLGNTLFPALPGTAVEAAAIHPLLGDATLLLGARATESALTAARGPKLLHLATHGFFLEPVGRPRSLHDAMLRSGLVFAGVNQRRADTGDDGVLTALEAAGLDLAGTRLAVLSACDTGLGDLRNGEGVFGLRRALVVAGAQTLVISLWEVEDDATQALMVDYYQRLTAGAGRVAALHQAQRAMLAQPRFAHPFFWAAFIASGQSGPLQ